MEANENFVQDTFEFDDELADEALDRIGGSDLCNACASSGRRPAE